MQRLEVSYGVRVNCAVSPFQDVFISVVMILEPISSQFLFYGLSGFLSED